MSKQQVNGPRGLLSVRNASVSTQSKHLAMPDRDTVMRHETCRDMETRDAAKTRRYTSVEAEPRLRHEKSCLETVSRQDTRLDTPSLAHRKEKGKEEYLYSAFLHQGTHKALRHGSHSFTCKQHHACRSFMAFTRCHHHSN